MTEETIKNTLTETRKQVLSPESHYEIAAKQLLEQHETEMVEFADWLSIQDMGRVIIGGVVRRFYPADMEKDRPYIYTHKDLLTLFKNRNK